MLIKLIGKSQLHKLLEKGIVEERVDKYVLTGGNDLTLFKGAMSKAIVHDRQSIQMVTHLKGEEYPYCLTKDGYWIPLFCTVKGYNKLMKDSLKGSAENAQ